jgi:hypothetical protein
VQIYAGGREVTGDIVQRQMIPAGLYLPPNPPSEYFRYPYVWPVEMVNPDPGPFPLPANMGCRLLIQGRLTQISATFVFPNTPQQIIVTPMGGQSFRARSYSGEGETGIFEGLNNQLEKKYGTRHDKFEMSVPAGADFFLLRYPPTPIDPYASVDSPINAGLAGSGTYRLERRNGGLSVDHLNTMLLPLLGQWQDTGPTADGFLPYRTDYTRLTSPEYFLPPGFDYQPCMTSGNCPDWLLQALWNHSYTIDLFYYKVERMEGSQLARIPARMRNDVGRSSAASDATAAQPGAGLAIGSGQPADLPSVAPDEEPPIGLYTPVPVQNPPASGTRIFLPLAARAIQPVSGPDPTDGCPCGWFDATGRMFDFIP